jgi:putative CocE/NonD family hydrolase
MVVQNERGRYFSEGEWDLLGPPKTDGYDTLSWIAEQPWSNGKVGTIGCSSSAEWQMGLAALDHPAHVAMIPHQMPLAGE